DGKPENVFAFSGEAKNKKYATEIIHECHEAWRRLVGDQSIAQAAGNLSILNSRVQGSPAQVHPSDPIYSKIPPGQNLPPAPIDPSISKW
ncbi:Inorganic pyrophosphatase, partial [Tulasnella sp. 408]